MLHKVFVVAGLLLGGAYAIGVEPDSLRTSGTSNPIDIDTTTPRLSWRLESSRRGDEQTAYQIQASSSSRFSETDLWDSGKVESSDPFAVYDGEALASRSVAFWRVKVWDVDGSESEWSELARFELALLDEEDWSASWIANTDFATGTNSLPVFAKEFSLECKPRSARLYLLGLGLHIPEINGEYITDEVLQPGYSTVNDTLFYSTYDVTEHLDVGDNVLGVSLGKGTYDAEEPLLDRYRKFATAYQELKLIAQLEYKCCNSTGSVVSDETWLTTVEGPYIEASWYGGEEYDARQELPDWSSVDGDRSEWSNATLTTGPSGKIVSPRAPPLKITETITPVSVTQNDQGYWVYDFGVNYAGTFSFKMAGSEDLEGTRITFWPDERSNIEQHTTGTPIFDAYTLSASESQTYSPVWLYHGFQYLGVNSTWEPSLDDMTGYVIRAVNEPVLTTSSSSDLFNSIHTIIDRSIQGNMHSVLTDCPHREKYGWLEQDHLVFEPVALGYDIQAYGDDLVRNIADAQAEDVPGLIPDIAPEYGSPMGGGYRNDPNWGCAVVLVPYNLYSYYGDIEILKMKHQYMIEYIDYLKRRANGNPWLDDGGLGDWLGLDRTTPKGSTSTFGFYRTAYHLSKVEEILGNEDTAQEYAQLAADLREGFHSKWFNETGGFAHYCQNSQACNAMALDIDAVPEEHKASVFGEIVKSLERNDWHMTVGEIALPSLFRVLRAGGREDVVYKIMSSTTSPSYGYQIEYGATSLWEHWDADVTGGSLNHFMYGYGDLWLLQLSGLSQKNTSVAWSDIVYAPIVEGDLTSASTSYITPRGTAEASWSFDGGELSYTITVPVGSTGWVYLNGTDVKEGGEELQEGDGIISVSEEEDATVIECGSGTYEFTAAL